MYFSEENMQYKCSEPVHPVGIMTIIFKVILR